MGKEEMTTPNSAKSTQYENTPHNVIANAAKFNKQFLDLNLSSNPTTVSIGKMLTLMSEQDNTIRVLSRLLERDYNEQHLHDMHNSLFGGLAEGPKSGVEDMHVVNILNQLTTFIHDQNQQIQALIDEIRKSIKHI